MDNNERQIPSEDKLRTARAARADTKLCNQARYRNPFDEYKEPELHRAWDQGYSDAGI